MTTFDKREEEDGFIAGRRGDSFDSSRSIAWQEGWWIAAELRLDQVRRAVTDLLKARRASREAQAKAKEENARHQ